MTLRLTILIRYDAEHESSGVLRHLLEDAARSIAETGVLTDDTRAKILSYEVRVDLVG